MLMGVPMGHECFFRKKVFCEKEKVSWNLVVFLTLTIQSYFVQPIKTENHFINEYIYKKYVIF